MKTILALALAAGTVALPQVTSSLRGTDEDAHRVGGRAPNFGIVKQCPAQLLAVNAPCPDPTKQYPLCSSGVAGGALCCDDGSCPDSPVPASQCIGTVKPTGDGRRRLIETELPLAQAVGCGLASTTQDPSCEIYGCDVCEPLGMVIAGDGTSCETSAWPGDLWENDACCYVNNGHFCCCPDEGSCGDFDTPDGVCPYPEPITCDGPNGEFAADTGCSIYGCDVCQPLGMVAAIFGLDASRGIECNNPNGQTEPPAGECCLVNNGYYCCCEGDGCEPFTPGEDCPYGDSPEPSSVPTPYPTWGGPQ